MDIIIGKTSGFCNGVDNTIKKAKEALEKYKKVYCLGEIVHNEQVVKCLENKGMITINSIDEVKSNSNLIIRAHGELKETYEIAKRKNINIIDLTCGKIKTIRIKIDKKKDNYFIVIIGKKNHPETLGVLSFSGNDSVIIENEEEIDSFIVKYNLSKKNKIYIVSQTTFNEEKFNRISSIIKDRIDDEVIIDKTICNATSNRQNETNEISKDVDTMIIIGGKNSSNTKELEVISKKNCNNVILVQDISGIKNKNIYGKVGIMAGASTPNFLVNEIIELLEEWEYE